MMYRRRLRLGVLEALERLAKQFRSAEDLWPLRIPREPVPFDEILARAIPEAARTFDPLTLRARKLLHLEWPDGSAWEAWVIVLPSNLRLFCDTGADETRVLASGGRNAGDETDRQFLMLLAESGGECFGIEMSGGAPSLVRSSIDDSQFLVDMFVELFEVTGMEASVREQLQRTAVQGTDFRVDVEEWLDKVRKKE